MAFRLVPTKAQYLLPFVMLIRIVPTDRFGMVIDTDAASFAALTFDPRRITIGRISTTAFPFNTAALANPTVELVEVDDAVDVVVAVDNVEVDVDVDVGSATIVSTASGSTAATTTVVGGTVVGATVVGATVVGGTVVGATVVGAIVVGATVVEVVVGTIFRVAIAVAFATFEFVPMPN